MAGLSPGAAHLHTAFSFFIIIKTFFEITFVLIIIILLLLLVTALGSAL
jgi:hypothetical protein